MEPKKLAASAFAFWQDKEAGGSTATGSSSQTARKASGASATNGAGPSVASIQRSLSNASSSSRARASSTAGKAGARTDGGLSTDPSDSSTPPTRRPSMRNARENGSEHSTQDTQSATAPPPESVSRQASSSSILSAASSAQRERKMSTTSMKAKKPAQDESRTTPLPGSSSLGSLNPPEARPENVRRKSGGSSSSGSKSVAGSQGGDSVTVGRGSGSHSPGSKAGDFSRLQRNRSPSLKSSGSSDKKTERQGRSPLSPAGEGNKNSSRSRSRARNQRSQGNLRSRMANVSEGAAAPVAPAKSARNRILTTAASAQSDVGTLSPISLDQFERRGSAASQISTGSSSASSRRTSAAGTPSQAAMNAAERRGSAPQVTRAAAANAIERRGSSPQVSSGTASAMATPSPSAKHLSSSSRVSSSPSTFTLTQQGDSSTGTDRVQEDGKEPESLDAESALQDTSALTGLGVMIADKVATQPEAAGETSGAPPDEPSAESKEGDLLERRRRRRKLFVEEVKRRSRGQPSESVEDGRPGEVQTGSALARGPSNQSSGDGRSTKNWASSLDSTGWWDSGSDSSSRNEPLVDPHDQTSAAAGPSRPRTQRQKSQTDRIGPIAVPSKSAGSRTWAPDMEAESSVEEDNFVDALDESRPGSRLDSSFSESSSMLRGESEASGDDSFARLVGMSSGLPTSKSGVSLLRSRSRLNNLPPALPSPTAPLPQVPGTPRASKAPRETEEAQSPSVRSGSGVSKEQLMITDDEDNLQTAKASSAFPNAHSVAPVAGVAAASTVLARGRPRGATISSVPGAPSNLGQTRARPRPRSLLANTVVLPSSPAGTNETSESAAGGNNVPLSGSSTSAASFTVSADSSNATSVLTDDGEDALSSKSSVQDSSPASVQRGATDRRPSAASVNSERGRSTSNASLLHQVSHPQSHASFVIAVVGHHFAGKSTVIKKGLRQFGLSKPNVLSDKVTSHSTVCVVDQEQRTIEVLEIDASALLVGPNKQFSWPKSLPPIDAVVLCYDASHLPSFRGMSELLGEHILHNHLQSL